MRGSWGGDMVTPGLAQLGILCSMWPGWERLG